MKLFPIQIQTDTHIQLYVHTYILLPVCHTIFIWQVSEIQRFTNFLVRRSPRCIFTVTDSNIALSYGGVLKMLVTWQCISTCEKISLTSEKDRDRLREKERDREKDRDRQRQRHTETETICAFCSRNNCCYWHDRGQEFLDCQFKSTPGIQVFLWTSGTHSFIHHLFMHPSTQAFTNLLTKYFLTDLSIIKQSWLQ